MNLQKFYMGEAFDAYDYFGAHLENGGVVFRTYAPQADKNTTNNNIISIFGNFFDMLQMFFITYLSLFSSNRPS